NVGEAQVDVLDVLFLDLGVNFFGRHLKLQRGLATEASGGAVAPPVKEGGPARGQSCIASPCSARSRPYTSSSSLTRRPVVNLQIIRITNVITPDQTMVPMHPSNWARTPCPFGR